MFRFIIINILVSFGLFLPRSALQTRVITSLIEFCYLYLFVQIAGQMFHNEAALCSEESAIRHGPTGSFPRLRAVGGVQPAVKERAAAHRTTLPAVPQQGRGCASQHPSSPRPPEQKAAACQAKQPSSLCVHGTLST